VRLIIVEDHAAIAHGLAALLGDTADIEVVGVSGDVAEASALIARLRPDVVLCDVMLRGRDSGFELLAAHGTETRFVMYSAFDLPSIHARALRRGAAGFVAKTAGADTVIEAIRCVAEGGEWFTPDVIASARGALRLPAPRELELLALVARGASNEAAAHELGISVKTVEGMLGRLFHRYDVDNRTQLTRIAIREGWLSTGERDGSGVRSIDDAS
jgi:DNA-binding NarL/FixJ family response regulator